MPLKIVELQAENIKRLKSVTIRPEGDVIILEDGEIANYSDEV